MAWWLVEFTITQSGQTADDERIEQLWVDAPKSRDALLCATARLEIGADEILHTVLVSPPKAVAPWRRALLDEGADQIVAHAGDDTVHQWFAACVVPTRGARLRPKAEAYEGSYLPWCSEHDRVPVSLTRFGTVLKAPKPSGCGVIMAQTPGKRDCYLGVSIARHAAAVTARRAVNTVLIHRGSRGDNTLPPSVECANATLQPKNDAPSYRKSNRTNPSS